MIINIDTVEIGDRRKPTTKAVEELAASISEVGLLNPISVINEGGPRTPKWKLVAGLHRLEACRSLGMGTITANEVKDTDADLVEIDENLARKDLTKLQRANAIKRKAEILAARVIRSNLDLTPQSGAPPTTGVGIAARQIAESGGTSKTEILRDVARGDIPEDIQERITETPAADSGVELDALASLSHDEQRQAVERVESGASPTYRDARDFIRGESAEEEKRTKKLASLRRAWTAADDIVRLTFWLEISEWKADGGTNEPTR